MSIKALHREIMRSAVYQLSAAQQAAAFAKDSGNRLYWRANRHRMSAEQIRDAILFVSGAIDLRVGGPSTALTPLANRRTIYGKVSRYKLDEFLQLFDFPSPSQTAEQRFSTNVPLQRLFFMNSDFMQQHAERLAEHVADEPDDAARIEKVYRGSSAAGRRRRGEGGARLPASRGAQAVRGASRQGEDASVRQGRGSQGHARQGRSSDSDADADAQAPPADGMMAGVMPGAKPPDDEKKKMLPVTTFGRYVKILLSSNEFLFVS